MALPILTITFNISEVPLTLSVLPWENWLMKKFSWSHPIKWQGFWRLWPHKILPFWRSMFLINLSCKTQQRYFDLNVKKRSLENLSLISFTWTLVLGFFLDLVPYIIYRIIKWSLNRPSNDALRSCHFRETGKPILHKAKLSQKLINIYKHLASGKFITQKLS